MNLVHILNAPASAAPDAVALVSGGRAVSYGELAEQAARVAGGLLERGVRPGDRVGIVAANSPGFALAYLGVLHAGAVAVPVNPAGADTEIGRELGGTGTTTVVADEAGAARVEEAVASGALAGVRVVMMEGGEWASLLAAEPVPAADRSPSDPAVLVYTSGTGGAPRAAVLTHGNLAANLEQCRRHPTVRVGPEDVVLAVLPFFHVFGLNVVLGLGLASGARLVLTEGFDAAEVLELVRSSGMTVVPGVPPMFAAWLALPEPSDDAFATVRVAVSGAAPLPPEVQAGFGERFGVVLHQGYGLTEATAVVTTTLGERPPRPGSVGVPLPGIEVRLVDTSGADALVGDPGEIWVRGPNVFAGYWEEPEATARVLTSDGWLRTGDVAVADDEGQLSLVDRAKDLIIVSGFNVYPAEVEETLLRHPAVAEAAVVGVPDPGSGEAVKAFVVASRGAAPDPEELRSFCGRFLARYKCPVAVEVVPELPRGLAGKLLRRELA